MTENVYAPPLANLHFNGQPPARFYVVSQTKVFILSVLSFGFYFYYWSYKNWSLYKQATQADIWPWVRGLFCIFFIHKLYRQADRQIRASGRSFDFDFEQWATVFVVLTLGVSAAGWLAREVETLSFIGSWLLLVLPLRSYVIQKGQALINAAAQDPEGLGNSRFTLWDGLVIVPGAVIWASVLYRLWMMHR